MIDLMIDSVFQFLDFTKFQDPFFHQEQYQQ